MMGFLRSRLARALRSYSSRSRAQPGGVLGGGDLSFGFQLLLDLQHLVGLIAVHAPLKWLAATDRGDGDRRVDFGGELHGVEVPPGPPWGGVGSGCGGLTLGAFDGAAAMLQVDSHLGAAQIEIDTLNPPRVVEAEQVTVVGVEIVHFPKVAKTQRKQLLAIKFAEEPLTMASGSVWISRSHRVD